MHECSCDLAILGSNALAGEADGALKGSLRRQYSAGKGNQRIRTSVQPHQVRHAIDSPRTSWSTSVRMRLDAMAEHAA